MEKKNLSSPTVEVNDTSTALVNIAEESTVIRVENALQNDKAIAQCILKCFLDTPVVLPPSPTDPRQSLTHTCRLWRNIILSTPAFWNNIIFLPGPFSNVQKLESLSKQAIERSGELPLDFDFIGDPHDFWAHMAASNSVEDILYGRGRLTIMKTIVSPNKNRIRALKIMICTQKDFDGLIDIEGNLFPRCKELDIAIPFYLFPQFNKAFNYVKRKFSRGLDTLPHLRHLALRLLGKATFHPFDMRLRWHQLTELNFGTFFIPSNVFTEIMRRTSPSLRRGTFSIRSSQVACQVPQLKIGLVKMPFLLRLNLTVHNVSQDTRFFNAVKLPVLKFLQMQIVDNYATNCDITMITDMIKSSQALETLQISHATQCSSPIPDATKIAASPDIMSKFLEGLKCLSSLSLPGGMLLRASVIEKIASGELLPRLTDLEITAEEDWREIVSMIRTRNEGADQSGTEAGASVSAHVHTHKLEHVAMFMPESAYNKEKKIVCDELELLDGLLSLHFIASDTFLYTT